MKEEFSTEGHIICPEDEKVARQDRNNIKQNASQEGEMWNEDRLKHLLGEALGNLPTEDETREAWQAFTRRRASRRRRLYRIAASGIVAAACLGLIIALQPFLKREPQEVEVFTSLPAPKEIMMQEQAGRVIVMTPPATTTSIELSDGSRVLLSANSRLEYPKEFTDTLRRVALTGEARFEVAKDIRRPFIVCTEQLQTQVLGTVFDVKAYPNARPDVTLYEGRVNVSSNRRKQSKEMRPGEQVSLDGKGSLRWTKVDTDKQKGWTENEFSFDNIDLMQVMQEIGSWYNISVVFHSRRLLEERIYFHINRQPSVNAVLDALNDLNIGRFSVKDGKVVVTSPVQSPAWQ